MATYPYDQLLMAQKRWMPEEFNWLLNSRVDMDQRNYPYLPIFASSIANEASVKATSNYARCYVYNELSFNNWSNEAFMMALQIFINIYEYLEMNNPHENPNSRVEIASEGACRVITGDRVLRLTELQQVSDTNMIQAANEAVNEYNDLIRIEPMTMQQPVQPIPQPRMQNFRPGRLMNQVTPLPNRSWQRATGLHRVPERQLGIGHNYQDTKVGVPSFGVRPIQTRASEIQQLVVVGREDWRPSTSQPYLTYAPIGYQSEFYQSPTHGVSQTVKEDEHRLGSSAKRRQTHISEYIGGSRPYNLNQERIKQMTEIQKKDPTITIPNMEKWQIGPYLQTSVLDGAIKFMIYGNPENMGIYRLPTIITRPIVTDIDYTDLSTSLNSQSFSEMADKIKRIIDPVLDNLMVDEVKNHPIDYIRYIKWIDRWLTELIHSFIHGNLGLSTKYRMDSFSDDIADLITIIRKSCGDDAYKAFLEYEARVAKELFPRLPDGDKKKFKDTIIDDYSTDAKVVGRKVDLSMIYDRYMINYTGLSLEDLGIRPSDLTTTEKTTFKIDSIVQPFLYQLVQIVFEENAKFPHLILNNVLYTIDHHLLYVYQSPYKEVDNQTEAVAKAIYLFSR